ncbi:hypothetical protein BKK56_06630 [Rodentibacter genomosp. 2]|nr:hypothetical protein BKK56_06630 [Rodentibacter genomosp. 2]
MGDFHSLAKYAQNKTFLEFWYIKREWKIVSIYFLIGSIFSIFLLIINTIYTIFFIKYSKGLRKQSNLTCLFFILWIAIITYYFIIIDSSILLKFISKIVNFINKIEFIQ